MSTAVPQKASGELNLAYPGNTPASALQEAQQELKEAYGATIDGWTRLLDARGCETEGHCRRVAEMTLRMAQAYGLSDAEIQSVEWGALLHDVGTMAVPDDIMLKAGPLTHEEWAVMHGHPQQGFELLSKVSFLRGALDIPLCHHEKWDGTGYPRGLKGVEIPLPARLFAVADVWDSLLSDRPFRKAWPKREAREYIESKAGSHFDPKAVRVFLEVLRQDNAANASFQRAA